MNEQMGDVMALHLLSSQMLWYLLPILSSNPFAYFFEIICNSLRRPG